MLLERSDLNKKTKKELIAIICMVQAQNSRLTSIYRNKDYVIKSFKRQLIRLRDRMDYIINHPWATKNGGFNGRKN